MCLAIPAQIIEIKGEHATVDMDGIRKEVVISLIQDPKVGEYVIIHAGFALQKWSEQDVLEYHQIMKELKSECRILSTPNDP